MVWLGAPRGKLCAVPIDDCRLSFGGMALYPAYRASARFAQTLLRAWVTARALLPAQPRTCGGVWALGNVLRPVFPDAVGASALIAPRGATLLIMDRRGGALGYVKYAESAEGVRRLRNEADLVQRVPDGLSPRVLLHTRFGSGEILAESAIRGRPCAPRLALERPQRDFLGALARGSGTAACYAVTEHPLVLLHRNADGPHRPVLERALGALQGATWRRVLMHGDFTFANTRVLDGACAAFDWEWGSEAGFPYLDAAHWLIRVARGIQRLAPADAARRVVRALFAAIDEPDRGYSAGLAALAAIHSVASWYGSDLGASDEPGWLLRFAGACLEQGAPA